MRDKLLRFISRLFLNDRHSFHRRLIAALCCIVVFTTTYALVLPAITMTVDQQELSDDTLKQQPQTMDSFDPAQKTDVPENETAEIETAEIETAESESIESETAESETEETETAESETVETETQMPEESEITFVDYPAQYFEGSTRTVSVNIEAPEGALPDGTTMKLTDVQDADTINTIADAARSEMQDAEAVGQVCAVDITFYSAEGDKIEPVLPLTVVMTPKVMSDNVVHIVHINDHGDAQIIEQLQGVEAPSENAAVFEADSFSVYAVVVSTIEKTVLASDGHNYKVTVTYGADAGIPEDAELAVSELTGEDYQDYVVRAALNLDAGGFAYARIFDIAIHDEDGHPLQPMAPVSVAIKLMDGSRTGEDYSVVHFSGEEEVPEQMAALTDGNVVSFNTDGFSAYAIVQGPDAIPEGYTQIKTLDALKAHADTGLYIGTTGGYFMTNTAAIGTSDAATTGIVKTKPAQSVPPVDDASRYYFEAADGTDNQFYIYCYDADNNKKYVQNTGDANLRLVDDTGKTAFTVLVDNNGRFRFQNGSRYWNMWNGAGGNHIAAWTNATDGNNYFYLWDYTETGKDPYGLDGTSYGLMNWNGGTAGKALMAESGGANNLVALPLTVMSKTGNNSDKLFVPDNSEISLWKFTWCGSDKYYLTAEADGVTKYLKVTGSGLSLVDTPDDSCKIQVIPGTGVHAGEISLKSGNTTLAYSGDISKGFKTGGSAGTEWLRLVEISELTPDYFMIYSAEKVSVSDPGVTNGSRIIIYTRVWNEEKLRYDFYAVDHDGSLVPVYESGNDIQWVGARLNSMLWNFLEYYKPGTTEPNNYYDFYNQYSEKYIAPQVSSEDVLSDETIGVLLNGRREGRYYTPFYAWDNDHYTYAGLKADLDLGKIVSCARDDADDFYFAIVQDIPVDDVLHTVPTVDHTQYGITMKIVNFGGSVGKYPSQLDGRDGKTGDSSTTKVQHDVMGDSYWSRATDGCATSDLVSTDLDADGYPTAVLTETSLKELFKDAVEVNHLFVESTYNGTGYYEYDSTQNYAHLNNDHTFTVYQEIGTVDSSTGAVYQHGQFLPYNDIQAGKYASNNRQNLTTSTNEPLPEDDPRKYEQLYQVSQPDYYFGVELEAVFTQTESGLDDWGHDIIYEFTGDDDFWLYVDGERIIDLGGLHKALSGSVNYRTGVVKYVDAQGNEYTTTLRQQFEDNYKSRNLEATDDEVNAYLSQYFDEGETIFKAYSTHKMRIFYMERGAGASNLHMRFNLASIKPGNVELSKSVTGVETSESVYAEFPYQIYYKPAGGEDEVLLTNSLPDNPGQTKDYVYYKGTDNPVVYRPSLTANGKTYEHVFLLRPGQIAEISFPEEISSYRIVECAVNKAVYDSVKVNGQNALEESISESISDYSTTSASTEERAQVKFTNNIKEDALHTLKITKKLYQEDGKTEIPSDDDASFDFRLYLASEYDENLIDLPANMHSYSVKSPGGKYCRWDKDLKKFVETETTSLDGLTSAQLNELTFHTSINGAISRIPAGYSVEVRNVLVGTQFMVIERPTEMPDGYSFMKYQYSENGTTPQDYIDNSGNPVPALTGVSDTVTAGNHPDVYVCNIRGFGLRVNKVWSDADYMNSRDPVYFALYARDANDNFRLVSGSGRQMAYGTDTLYWYYRILPVPDVPFNDYEIREVAVIDHPVIDTDGIVDDDSITGPIAGGSTVTLGGLQKGENVPGSFPYTVTYAKGEPSGESHVRVDTVTNSRPGIVIKKTKGDGQTPLAGAVFTLDDNDETQIGTFTSDNKGLVTVAFLGEGKTYTLTETKTPDGFHGLEKPIHIVVNNNVISVSETEDYDIIPAADGTMPTLVIKNRELRFKARKVDDDGVPLDGVKFALYKKHVVDGAVQYDPVQGFNELVTASGGIIPGITESLGSGTYELRELSTLPGYQEPTQSSYVRFTVSDTGVITLEDNVPEGVSLSKDVAENVNIIEYTLEIPNHLILTLKKVDDRNQALKGSKFKLNKLNAGQSWEEVQGYGNIDLTAISETPLTGLTSGRYQLVECKAPDGYVILEKAVYFKLEGGRMILTDENGAVLSGDALSAARASVSDDGHTLTVSNAPGSELPSTGGPGTTPIYILGILLAGIAAAGLVMKKREDAA